MRLVTKRSRNRDQYVIEEVGREKLREGSDAKGFSS
jgi:hypothetical protein